MKQMLLKTKSGLTLKLDTTEDVDLSNVKDGDYVELSLRKASKYYHPFLNQFKIQVLSATGEQITCKSPVKSTSKALWILTKEDISSLKKVL
jgi:hypothetical protein